MPDLPSSSSTSSRGGLLPVMLLMALVALITPGALAQGGTCFTLNKDNICGKDFEGLPVSLQTYRTNEGFNTILSDTFNNVDSVAKEFEDVFGCPVAAVRSGITSMRFQISYACADAVSKAIAAGCTPSTTPSGKGPALCLPQCEMAVATLERLFQDRTACPGATNGNRTLVVDEMRRVCGTYRPAQNTQQCSLGTTAEGQFCGWASRALAQQECAKVPGDNCCTKLLNGKPSGTTEQPGTSTSSSTAAASNGAPSNTSGLSPGITTLIIVVVLVMVLGAGLFLYFRMRSSKPQNTGGNRIPAFKASPMSRDSFFEPKPKGLKQNSFFSPMMESAKSPAQSPGNNGYLRTVTVTHPYDATLQDELALNIGDQVHIVKEFDDGWALGVHAVTQQEGAFPLVCTEDRSDSGSETNDNRLTLPPFSASDDPEAGWKKGAESIRISKRMSSQIWDKESRLSSDGRSSVNPFRGRATTSMNSFGSPLKQNFSRDMRDTPKDDYYDELDNDLPSQFGVQSKSSHANYL